MSRWRAPPVYLCDEYADPLAGLERETGYPDSEQTPGEAAVLLPVAAHKRVGVFRRQFCQESGSETRSLR